jgi:bifunctional non-homologous end joining protein LigD
LTRKEQIPFRVQPMLASLVAKPFHRPGWVYEEKYDGYRLLAYKEGKRVTLLSRTAHDRTGAFPMVANSVATLKPRTLLLDGEVVAFDRKLVSRFQLLQRGDPALVFAVFDCLYVDGRDLRKTPLAERRIRLETEVHRSDRIFPARRLASDGLAAFRMARKKGFEGIIAKDSKSIYEERRSSKWLKIKVHMEEEFVIGGYTRPAGSRSHFGALLLGAFKGDDFHYVGKVGTGFSQKTLASLWKQFQPFIIEKTPFVNPPREKGVLWVAPHLVAQVVFHEWTKDGRLRAPAFLGLRDDKKPKECILPAGI